MVGGGGAGRGTIARGSSWPTTHAQPALVCMRRNMAPTFISPPMSAAPLAPPPPRTWIVPVCACPATPCAERSTNTDVKARILAGTVDRPTMQRDCGRETAREHFGHDTSRPYGLPQPLDLQMIAAAAAATWPSHACIVVSSWIGSKLIQRLAVGRRFRCGSLLLAAAQLSTF
jgi:hypothetical protein